MHFYKLFFFLYNSYFLTYTLRIIKNTYININSFSNLTTPTSIKNKPNIRKSALCKAVFLCILYSSFHILSSSAPKLLDLCSCKGPKRSSSVSFSLNVFLNIGNMYLETKISIKVIIFFL